MEPALPAPAVAADAAAVTEVVVALERSLYGQTAFTQADLEDEWSAMDLEQDARVVRAGDRIVGYGAVRERGELWRAEGYVHPDALGRGIGKLIATGIEEDAARHGARKIQNGVFEADPAARSLLESLGYDAGASSASCASSSRRRRPPPCGRTGCASSRSTRSMTRSSSTPRTRKRSQIIGSTPRATSGHGRRTTSRASASTRRSGASSAPGPRSPPARSAQATRTVAAGSTRSSRVARGVGRRALSAAGVAPAG